MNAPPRVEALPPPISNERSSASGDEKAGPVIREWGRVRVSARLHPPPWLSTPLTTAHHHIDPTPQVKSEPGRR
jgi:hypothetical protein